MTIVTTSEIAELRVEAAKRIAELNVEQRELEARLARAIRAVEFDEVKALELQTQIAERVVMLEACRERLEYLQSREGVALNGTGLVELEAA